MIWNYAEVVFHNASGVNVGGRTGQRPRQATSSSMLSFIYPPTSRHDESCASGCGGRESPTDFPCRLTRGERTSRRPSLIYPPTSRHDESCAPGCGGRESPTDFACRLTRGESHLERTFSLIYPPTSRHDESCAPGCGGRESPTKIGWRLTRGERANFFPWGGSRNDPPLHTHRPRGTTGRACLVWVGEKVQPKLGGDSRGVSAPCLPALEETDGAPKDFFSRAGKRGHRAVGRCDVVPRPP
jgi:hypothetical protein